jgi:glutaredoxin
MDEPRVKVVGRETCMWTSRVRDLFTARGIAIAFVEVDVEEAKRLTAETRQSTTPWVFVRGQLVGGFNRVDELDRLGQLDELVSPREAAPGPLRTRIVPADAASEQNPVVIPRPRR